MKEELTWCRYCGAIQIFWVVEPMECFECSGKLGDSQSINEKLGRWSDL